MEALKLEEKSLHWSRFDITKPGSLGFGRKEMDIGPVNKRKLRQMTIRKLKEQRQKLCTLLDMIILTGKEQAA